MLLRQVIWTSTHRLQTLQGIWSAVFLIGFCAIVTVLIYFTLRKIMSDLLPNGNLPRASHLSAGTITSFVFHIDHGSSINFCNTLPAIHRTKFRFQTSRCVPPFCGWFTQWFLFWITESTNQSQTALFHYKRNMVFYARFLSSKVGNIYAQ